MFVDSSLNAKVLPIIFTIECRVINKNLKVKCNPFLNMVIVL